MSWGLGVYVDEFVWMVVPLCEGILCTCILAHPI